MARAHATPRRESVLVRVASKLRKPTTGTRKGAGKKGRELGSEAAGGTQRGGDMQHTGNLDIGAVPKGRKRLDAITPDAEWLKSKLRDRRLTQRQLATALGKDASIITRALQGNRRFSLDEFTALCDVLHTAPAETLRALGYDVADYGVAVVGSIREGAAVSAITSQLGRIHYYKSPPATAKALVFESRTGPLAAYHGAVLVYEEAPAGKVPPDTFGRLCLVEAADQLTPLLGVLGKASSRGAVALAPFGGGEPIELQEVVRASVVLGLFF
jgi:transcriptional regulator with XRE-family HTH domain